MRTKSNTRLVTVSDWTPGSDYSNAAPSHPLPRACKRITLRVIQVLALDEGGFCAIVLERAPRPARQSIATMIAVLRGFAAWAPALVL